MENIIDWNENNKKSFTKELQIFDHNLHQSQLFDDEGIIKIIDNYPFDKLEIFTMGDNPKGWGEWFLGRRGKLSGRELFEAVKQGKIWLNLRGANTNNPSLDNICEAIFSEIKSNTDIDTFKHDMGMLISSPKAHVYYHADMPLVMLWQIRGVKRVYLYPADEPHINDKQLEAIALKETDEQLKFAHEFEENEFVHDLHPGEMVSWPQNCPHRIENLDCVNVSFSIEFQTTKSAWRANLLYANGILRRYFNLSPSINKSSKILEPIKIIIARIIKMMGGYKGPNRLPIPIFSLDAQNLGKLIFDDQSGT